MAHKNKYIQNLNWSSLEAIKARKFSKFFWDQDENEVIDDYVYLGVNYNGYFKNATNKKYIPGKKAVCPSWKSQSAAFTIGYCLWAF